MLCIFHHHKIKYFPLSCLEMLSLAGFEEAGCQAASCLQREPCDKLVREASSLQPAGN